MFEIGKSVYVVMNLNQIHDMLKNLQQHRQHLTCNNLKEFFDDFYIAGYSKTLISKDGFVSFSQHTTYTITKVNPVGMQYRGEKLDFANVNEAHVFANNYEAFMMIFNEIEEIILDNQIEFGYFALDLLKIRALVNHGYWND